MSTEIFTLAGVTQDHQIKLRVRACECPYVSAVLTLVDGGTPVADALCQGLLVLSKDHDELQAQACAAVASRGFGAAGGSRDNDEEP